MDLDVLERARAGDRTAYAGLITTWGERVARAAALLAGRSNAERIAATAFTMLWNDLAEMHSEQPFRPTLMRAVVDAATTHDGPATDEGDPVQRALATLEPEARALIVEHLYAGMAATEIMLVRRELLGKTAKALRDAMRAFTTAARDTGLPADEAALRDALAAAVADVELPAWFAEESVLPRLREPEGPDVRRLVRARADTAWAALLDADTVRAWGPEDARLRGATSLEPGARIIASGRIGGRRASRDETLITRAGADRVLAWTTRAHLRPWTSAIELRWTLQVTPDGEQCELTHRLRGVAFPRGFAGRALRSAWARVAGAVPQDMHAGIERLAQHIESRAPRASL